MNEERGLFTLTSWGHAGVPWIAKCLNLHPSIHTFVNRRAALSNIAGRPLSAPDYLRHLATLSDGYEVCGDIQGISPHEFGEISTQLGDGFRGAHLMAHPVVRFAGSLAYSRSVNRHYSHQYFLDQWQLDRRHPLSRPLLDHLGENGDHVPAHYMMHVNGVVKLTGTAPFFRLERLMSDDTEWAAMIRYLSAGRVEDFGTIWRRLQGAYIGIAHEPFRANSPEAVWRTLPRSTQQVMVLMLSLDARAAYADLGYDLSFMT